MTLQVESLSCLRGGRRLFDNLSFTVRPGELLHVQGANGSGKTSLLRILTGLARQETGHVLWDGTDIRQSREEFVTRLLYLGHQPALKDDLSVRENLQVAARIAGLRPTAEAVQNALRMVGLDGRAALPARVLSQGQRRRLALARLWLDERPLWVLDEPYTALDTHAALALEARLEQHLGNAGMVILTTHQRPSIAEHYLRILSVPA